MRSLLFITHSFPPFATAGVERALGFVRYLPEFGWLPTVLTVRDNPAYGLDRARLSEIPECVHVERTAQIPLARFIFALAATGMGRFAKKMDRRLFFPDSAMGWVPFALRHGMRLVKKHSIEFVYTTSPPESVHLVGYFLKKRLALRWVADFRNEWTSNPYRGKFPSNFHMRLNLGLERKFLKAADALVTLSPSHTRMLRAEDPEHAGKYHTIENGFDTVPAIEESGHSPSRNGRLTFAYAGSFYADQRPDTLLLAAIELMREGKLPENEFRIRVAGYQWEGSQILKGKPFVEHMGVLPHSKVWEFYREADVLLLVVAPDAPRTLPGKLYEYIASGRPILALVPPEGLAADLVRRTKTGVVVRPDDVEAIKEAVLNLHAAWKNGNLKVCPDMNEVSKYERRKQVKVLADILDSICT